MSEWNWQWNEMQQVGTDYADIAEVEKYDRRMGEFRDVEAENRGILELLNLPAGSRILEIGCGTGRFARAAAKAGHCVTAADISPMMLEYVAARAKREGLDVECVHAGFLSIPDSPERFDAVVSGAALHHLPDVWKTVAIQRIFKVLKPGGRFVLRDVVFDWPEDKHAECFEQFVGALPEGTQKEAARHAATEFSTHNWIIEGMLSRSGFTLLDNQPGELCFRQYHCRKE